LVITLAVVGVIGYVPIASQLRSEQIANYASIVQADAHGLEAVGRTSRSTVHALQEIDHLLGAVGHRSGVLLVQLIDQSHSITAAGTVSDETKFSVDPRIDAALLHGTSYAGHEADPARNAKGLRVRRPDPV